MIKRRANCIVRDSSGSVAIEFALLIPVLITMMLGVFQIGITMNSYNAMRSAAADISRYAVVQYQTGSYRDTNDLTTTARTMATSAPYMLDTSRLTISVSRPVTQRVAGTTELSVSIRYNAPSVMNLIGVSDIPLSYSQPVFLVE
ncbi:TadE/TadG family type IV pilus assembly protein [Novosphingobium sp.]|uniref:TadE family protein n=1 Tax=Novosphingobium sp. TaxID=1874826 RepID=UPI00286DCE39|nr:TadE/TadG family type IV pilus assembly protein [Novosphingobium sp.]